MKTTQARRDELRLIAKILQGKPNWKCATGEEAIDLLDDVEELRETLKNALVEMRDQGMLDCTNRIEAALAEPEEQR